MFFDYTFILLIPALILAFYAQAKVSSAYSKLSKKRASAGLTGREVAEMLVESLGLRVKVEEIPGALTDHYDPTREVLRLSQAVANGSSIADYSIVAHEVGHVLQKREQYPAFAFRSALVPVASFGSQLALPLFLIGLIFYLPALMNIGIIFFSLAVLFQLVTLPVEYNASSRAYLVLDKAGLVTAEEKPYIKQMLNAAALTYVAATAMAALQLLRLVLLRGSRD
ncbi:MAG TPA: zinc metallopeptidase [Candidatus Atribacteria bacterium]|jgi:Zn-dependent membrane protease YugP|uniref:zinc metallopeptidase n=1 Tax=Candidatus Sordicultor fermentans TaxID=1953203 RepID=UPI00169560F3|nr:zinc metallopeptidase [Atribacterota bacterium]NLY05867.1 zinc metallopeptidase [Candidatus Atribacteria bacterium]MDI9608276.1 zinc metallopeptidase [Atribacterota bacterium]HOA99182.1 zinc metallopeptidase [Candidatus Atribacteria bacterium]HOQ51186.1 zinc metallopeptidase [Candidatus Atribacteria bacterium]